MCWCHGEKKVCPLHNRWDWVTDISANAITWAVPFQWRHGQMPPCAHTTVTAQETPRLPVFSSDGPRTYVLRAHLWTYTTSLYVICWILWMMGECRWQCGGNAAQYTAYSIRSDIAWSQQTPRDGAFMCRILRLQMNLRHDKLRVSMSFTANFLQCFWPQRDPNALTMRGPLLQRSLLSERTRVSSLLSDCILPPLLCVFWGKVLVGYEADECTSSAARGAESFSWVQRFSLSSLMAPRCFLKQQPLSLSLHSLFFCRPAPPPVCLSPFTYSAPSFCLSFQFFPSLQGSHPSQKCSLHLVWS